MLNSSIYPGETLEQKKGYDARTKSEIPIKME